MGLPYKNVLSLKKDFVYETISKWGLRPVARHRRQFRSGSGYQHDATICCVLAKNEARRSSGTVSPHFEIVS